MKSFSFRRVLYITQLIDAHFRPMYWMMWGVYTLFMLFFIQIEITSHRNFAFDWMILTFVPLFLILLGFLQYYLVKSETNIQMIPGSNSEKTLALFIYALLVYIVFPLTLILFVTLKSIDTGVKYCTISSVLSTIWGTMPYMLVIVISAFYGILVFRKRSAWIIVVLLVVVATCALGIAIITDIHMANFRITFSMGFDEKTLFIIRWMNRVVLLSLSGYLGFMCFSALKNRELR